MKTSLKLLCVLVVGAMTATSSFAATTTNNNTPSKILRVDVQPMNPFVFRGENGEWEGLEVDLLQHIASELGYTNLSFREVKFRNIFDGVLAGDADAAISGITITSKREDKVDFVPHLSAGLDIMVRKEQPSASAFIHRSFLSYPALPIGVCAAAAFGLFLLITAFLKKAEKPTANTVTKVLRFVGAAVVILYLVAGLASGSAYVFSSVYGRFDEHAIDLRNRKVATEADTTSVDELKARGARVVEVSAIEDAYVLLRRGEVDAVVFDAPALWNFSSSVDGEFTRCTGKPFSVLPYGIAIAPGSTNREAMTRAALRWMESDEFVKAKRNYFGNYE